MMRDNPHFLLFGLFFAIWLGAQSWRRRRLKRAARDLPTRLRRMLGPEPDYCPPPGDHLPAEMQDFARLHRRTARVQRALWGAAGLWLLFVIFLLLRKQLP